MDRLSKTQRIAFMGILISVALVLGYIEQMIPLMPGVPGIKLGLANIVLLYALYLLDWQAAVLLMILKIVLSGFMFSGMSGILYSGAGGILSLFIMIMAKKVKSLSIVGVSILGGTFHNIGQMAVAMMIVQTKGIIFYFPVLLIAGVVMGMITGIVGKVTISFCIAIKAKVK